MSQQFLAQSLNSRNLLALLFICEAKRKGLPTSIETFKANKPAAWEEVISTFADRLTNLTEAMRFEVLEAHLMSVEDLDVYHDETLKMLLDENRPFLNYLEDVLSKDERFDIKE